MDRLTTIKAAACTAAAALTAFWGWTGWLAAAWFLAMLLDYATGSAAALRAGAGLGTVACPDNIWQIIQTLCPCATCLPRSSYAPPATPAAGAGA